MNIKKSYKISIFLNFISLMYFQTNHINAAIIPFGISKDELKEDFLENHRGQARDVVIAQNLEKPILLEGISQQPSQEKIISLCKYSKTISFLLDDEVTGNLFPQEQFHHTKIIPVSSLSSNADSDTINLLGKICKFYDDHLSAKKSGTPSNFKKRVSDLLSKTPTEKIVKLLLVGDDIAIKPKLFHKVCKLALEREEIGESGVANNLYPNYLKNKTDRKFGVSYNILMKNCIVGGNIFFLGKNIRKLPLNELENSQQLKRTLKKKSFRSVEEICLTNRNIESIEQILWLVKKFSNVKKIDLSDNQLRLLSLPQLLRLPSGATLNLRGNPIEKLVVPDGAFKKVKLNPAMGLEIKLNKGQLNQTDIDKMGKALNLAQDEFKSIRYNKCFATSFIAHHAGFFWIAHSLVPQASLYDKMKLIFGIQLPVILPLVLITTYVSSETMEIIWPCLENKLVIEDEEKQLVAARTNTRLPLKEYSEIQREPWEKVTIQNSRPYVYAWANVEDETRLRILKRDKLREEGKMNNKKLLDMPEAKEE